MLKSIFIIGFFWFLVGVVTPFYIGNVGGGGSPLDNAIRICIIRIPDNCTVSSPICGKYGNSNLCKQFKNNCAMQIDNCASTGTQYKKVPIARCSGIALNQRKQCRAASGGSSAGSSNSIVIQKG